MTNRRCNKIILINSSIVLFRLEIQTKRNKKNSTKNFIVNIKTKTKKRFRQYKY